MAGCIGNNRGSSNCARIRLLSLVRPLTELTSHSHRHQCYRQITQSRAGDQRLFHDRTN